MKGLNIIKKTKGIPTKYWTNDTKQNGENEIGDKGERVDTTHAITHKHYFQTVVFTLSQSSEYGWELGRIDGGKFNSFYFSPWDL